MAITRQELRSAINAFEVILAANISKAAVIEAFNRAFPGLTINGEGAERSSFGWIAGADINTLVFVGQGVNNAEHAIELLGSSTVPMQTIYDFRVIGAIYNGYQDAREYILRKVREGVTRIFLFGHSAAAGFCNIMSSILGKLGYDGVTRVITIASPKATDSAGVFYARNFDVINFSALGDPICNIPPSDDILDAGGVGTYALQNLVALTVGDTAKNRRAWRVFADPARVWLDEYGRMVSNPPRSLIGDGFSAILHYIPYYISLLEQLIVTLPSANAALIQPATGNRGRRIMTEEIDIRINPDDPKLEGLLPPRFAPGGAHDMREEALRQLEASAQAPENTRYYTDESGRIIDNGPTIRQRQIARRFFSVNDRGVPADMPDGDHDTPSSMPRAYRANVEKHGSGNYVIKIGNAPVANFSRHRAAKKQCHLINQMVEHLGTSQNFNISLLSAAIEAVLVVGSGRQAARQGVNQPLPGY